MLSHFVQDVDQLIRTYKQPPLVLLAQDRACVHCSKTKHSTARHARIHNTAAPPRDSQDPMWA